MAENIQRVADTITEKTTFFCFGLLPILVRPLTLAQMYEIGAAVENADGLEVQGKVNPVALMLSNFENIELCSKVVNIILFRSRWKRLLLGWYVKRNLTMAQYRRVIEYSASCFGAAFFLTSFTFLVGTKTMTKPTNTDEAIPSGDSLEE